MLESIKNTLQMIGDFFIAVFDFVVGFVEDIIYVVKITAEAVASIPNYLTFLPGSVGALIITIMAIVVIYKILGREG